MRAPVMGPAPLPTGSLQFAHPMLHEAASDAIQTPTETPVSDIQAAPVEQTLEVEEEEPVGLAGGMSAPKAAAYASPGVQPLPTESVASKYYPGQVIDPRTGQHFDSATGQPVVTPPGPALPNTSPILVDAVREWKEARKSFFGSVGQCLLAFAGVLLVAALIGYFQPGAYIPLVLITCFIGGVLLPVTRAAPWADEDSDDVLFLIFLTVLFGPAVGLLAYTVLALVRQDVNPAVMGCFLMATLARFGIDLAAGSPTFTQFMPFQVDHFNWKATVLNWSPLVAMAGWYAAGVFHKLDE